MSGKSFARSWVLPFVPLAVFVGLWSWLPVVLTKTPGPALVACVCAAAWLGGRLQGLAVTGFSAIFALSVANPRILTSPSTESGDLLRLLLFLFLGPAFSHLIPARRKYREEIHLGRERLELALGAASMGIWELELDSGMANLDQRALACLGLSGSHSQAPLRDLEKAVDAEDLPVLKKRASEAAAQGRSFQLEFRVLWPDGSSHWLIGSGRPVGRGQRFVGTLQEITLRKQIESELLRALKVQDDFLSVASHELRTPLTALKLQLEMIQREFGRIYPGEAGVPARSGEAVLRYLSASGEQANRLGRLINDLLDVSKIQVQGIPLALQPIDVAELARGILGQFQVELQVARCELTSGIDKPVMAYCDRHRIEQVIINLLSNAVKYGGGRPVEVRVAAEGDMARIDVIDQGIGIPKEAHERIFNRYERLDSATHVSGLGIGLFLVRSIVEAHSGQVSVESAPQNGATFTVRIPSSPPQ